MKVKFRKSYKKIDPKIPRLIYAKGEVPPELVNEAPSVAYVDNTIKSSQYTVYNFLPKNLFRQFRRIANFYFLCLCIIHFSIDSPVSPITSLLPLLFVVIVTGVKQGFEDWKRHLEDDKVNNAPSKIMKDRLEKIARWQICVGDIVKVSADEEFPCDLVLLFSSNMKSKCEVTTANLDGETNLKTFHCPLPPGEALTEDKLSTFLATIECEHPNPNLYDFKGRMELFDEDSESGSEEDSGIYSLGTENLLLRGARLKNTEYIYGCAVYTGKETKMALNSKMTSAKFSTAERTCNVYLLTYLGVLLFEVFLCTLLKYQLYGEEKTAKLWYIGPIDVSTDFGSILEDAFSFFILFSYIIPISLYVTLEMQKFLGSFFFQWDEEMRGGEGNEYPICNTSDLNEELGQVQYLFTDKTGTLTENTMHFRQCSIAGVKFCDKEGMLNSIDNESVERIPEDIKERIDSFLLTLALCHTVTLKKAFRESEDLHLSGESSDESIDRVVGLKEATREYQASSPDEKALVEACSKYGIVFTEEAEGEMLLVVHGEANRFQRLDVLEFDSDRKMMTVIVRDLTENKIWAVAKGAESAILKKCLPLSDPEDQSHDYINKHIDDFARLGLRTLAVARKEVTAHEYENLSKKLALAKQEISNREQAVRSVMDDFENGFTLLGATGVEDLLQDGVQETLESLSVAGIKVWVLTGDKVETAVNIAFLCGLFKKFMELIYLTNLDNETQINNKLEESEKQLVDDDKNYGLVVDGKTLLLLMDFFREEFYEVCSRCSAVVCCRMSPKQKAEIVKLVKSCSSKRAVCAAVGDGANDVSMIQEAHIGLGIMGKEGRQAVRCSDFALARFRFLRKALLVHGHWYYNRIATLILYCFYKNVAFITPQVFFTFQSAYSTQSIYEGLVLTLFNVTYTSLPIIIYGLFEQTHSQETLLSKPFLYKQIRNNRSMSFSIFTLWGVLGLWHAFVLYYGLFGSTFDSSYIQQAKTQDIYSFGLLLTTNVIFVCNLKLMIESRFQTWFFIGSIALTLVGYYLAYFVYCVFPRLPMYWTFYLLHATPLFYFSSLFVVVLSLLPDFLIKVFINSKTFSVREVARGKMPDKFTKYIH